MPPEPSFFIHRSLPVYQSSCHSTTTDPCIPEVNPLEWCVQR